MALLSERDRQLLHEKFEKELTGAVTIHSFTRPVSRLVVPGRSEPVEDIQLNQLNTELVEEVAALSHRITVVHHDGRDASAQDWGIDRFPAIVLEGANKGLVRFIGVPHGTEFAAFVEDIVHAGNGSTRLSQTTVDELAAIETDVHIQVFSTPTCPWCPRAATMAHQMAVASEFITADAIDVTEFPDLATRYGVRAVPKIVINETTTFEGALPEEEFLDHVLAAIVDQE